MWIVGHIGKMYNSKQTSKKNDKKKSIKIVFSPQINRYVNSYKNLKN